MVYEVNEYYGDEMSSENSLSHYGILGMKWGVRRYQNPDGTLTAAGKERYYGKEASDKLAKELRGYRDYVGSKGNGSRYTRLANSVPMKTVAASVRKLWDVSEQLNEKARKTERNFEKRKDLDRWIRRAAEEDWKEQNRNGSLENEGWTFGDWFNMYKYDDFDQGQRTTRSFDYWLKESGEKEAKEYLRNEKMSSAADKQYREECKKAVQAFLGEHGNEKVTWKSTWGGQTRTHQKDLADRGVDIVTNIMNTWDTFTSDFNSPPPIEDLMGLTN